MKTILAAALLLWLLAPPPASAQQVATLGEKSIGTACNNGADAVNFDTLAQCSATSGSGTFQKAPLFVGQVTSPPYATTACDAAKAGMLQYTASGGFQGCNGSGWNTMGSGGASSTSATDPYASYVVSLLHFEGGITDDKGKTWTANGGASATNVGAKFGTGSLYLNGSGQDLYTAVTSDFDFATGNFTIDWWEYRLSTSTNGVAFSIETSDIDPSAYNSSLSIGWIEAGATRCFLSSTGNGWDIMGGLSMGTPTANTWTHYAFVRSGSTFYTFQNGALISTYSSAASIYYNSGYKVYIGGRNNSYFNGYIDELRVTKGVARWTTSFPPPNQPYSLQ